MRGKGEESVGVEGAVNREFLDSEELFVESCERVTVAENRKATNER